MDKTGDMTSKTVLHVASYLTLCLGYIDYLIIIDHINYLDLSLSQLASTVALQCGVSPKSTLPFI